MADGLWLGKGEATSTRAACLLRRGSANVGFESPAHDTAMQYAPPQNPVLPVEEGSTGQLPELTPLGLPRVVAERPKHIDGVICYSSV